MCCSCFISLGSSEKHLYLSKYYARNAFGQLPLPAVLVLSFVCKEFIIVFSNLYATTF